MVNQMVLGHTLPGWVQMLKKPVAVNGDLCCIESEFTLSAKDISSAGQ